MLLSATISSARASTARGDGDRVVHSLRTPVILNDAVIAQLISGGFRNSAFPPKNVTTHFPVSIRSYSPAAPAIQSH